jgi:hypothetical protein
MSESEEESNAMLGTLMEDLGLLIKHVSTIHTQYLSTMRQLQLVLRIDVFFWGGVEVVQGK